MNTDTDKNNWIASLWFGRKVKQVSGDQLLVGRTGVVRETMFDERGALHCLVKMDAIDKHDDSFWCPAIRLEYI